MKSKFINPFTDFGFKKIFGQDTIFQQAFEKSEIAKYLDKDITNLYFFVGVNAYSIHILSKK